jgi:hypothetical protein
MGSPFVLRWIVGVGVVVALYQAVNLYIGRAISGDFIEIWGLVLAIMLAVWVDEDSKHYTGLDRPSFDLGFFSILAWPFYIPYYLLKTRGRRGWLWILGLFVLAFLGTLFEFVLFALR